MDLAVPVSAADHIQGPDNAPLTLVEYGDYQCPDAGRFHALFEAILDRHGPDIRFVYRHFPLPMHADAGPAAEAAEAAGAQGKFFEMHHYLYQHQHRLSLRDFVQFAELLALDEERFRKDLKESAYRDRIEADMEGARKSGVKGVPAIFLNGSRYAGPVELQALLHAIEGALQPR